MNLKKLIILYYIYINFDHKLHMSDESSHYSEEEETNSILNKINNIINASINEDYRKKIGNDMHFWHNLADEYFQENKLSKDQVEILKIVGKKQQYKLQSMMLNLWQTNPQFRKIIVNKEFNQVVIESLLYLVIESGFEPKKYINHTNYIYQISL